MALGVGASVDGRLMMGDLLWRRHRALRSVGVGSVGIVGIAGRAAKAILGWIHWETGG